MTSKERYYWYKSHGICVDCGCEDAAEGRIKCLNCLEKQAESQMRYREAHKEKIAEENIIQCRMRYAGLKAVGLCVDCGQREPETGVLCDACRVRRSVHYYGSDLRQRRKEKRLIERRKREKSAMADIGRAVMNLIEEYGLARDNEYVRKPISYALYQTWKKWETKEKEREVDG